MAISNKASGSVNFNAAIRKIKIIEQVLKQPEFQQTVEKLITKSGSERTKFVESELTIEALAKKGIELPKGLKVVFKPASTSGNPRQKKRIIVNLMIPDVGTVSFRSPIKDNPGKDEK